MYFMDIQLYNGTVGKLFGNFLIKIFWRRLGLAVFFIILDRNPSTGLHQGKLTSRNPSFTRNMNRNVLVEVNENMRQALYLIPNYANLFFDNDRWVHSTVLIITQVPGMLEDGDTGGFMWLHNHLDGDSKTSGYALAKRIHDHCNKTKTDVWSIREPLFKKYGTPSGTLNVCPIWKAGTTFIKRLFLMITDKKFKHITNPYDISFGEEFGSKGWVYNNASIDRFMFVRNPYNRLVSGYVDKLLAPNPVYWGFIGRSAIMTIRKNASSKSLRCGHDLTFTEYIKYIIFEMKRRETRRRKPGYNLVKDGINIDIHFEKMTILCKLCKINFTFVGKMEHISTDIKELLIKMNLTRTLDVLKTNGKKLAELDAIQDTVSQPFDQNFRNSYRGCISINEAFERTWQKLKARGLIGDVPLPLTSRNFESVTKSEFLEMAIKANKATPKEERRQLEKKIYYNYYKIISTDDLERLADTYKDDFTLFEYESRPDDLFKRST